MPASIYGIGTCYYGQTDLRSDGSCISTKWFAVLYFPLIPLGSYRLVPDPKGEFHFFVEVIEYRILEELDLNVRQVVRTYLFSLACVVWWSAILYGATLKIDYERHPYIFVTIVFSLAAFPFLGLWWKRRLLAQKPTELPQLSADKLSEFMHTYYREPRPERVAEAIQTVHRSGILIRESAPLPTVVGFFSEVFANNPTWLGAWRNLIENQPDPARSALRRALALSVPPGVLGSVDLTPGTNDLIWGAFFASGKRDYVLKLVERLILYDERENRELFLTGATALWSLASVAANEPFVRSTLVEVQGTAKGRTRVLIGRLLESDPEQLWSEARKVSERHQVAGKWR